MTRYQSSDGFQPSFRDTRRLEATATKILTAAVVLLSTHSSAIAEDEFALQLLGASDVQVEKLEAGQKAGLLELAPVHLPINPPGDCNHYGWPVATMSGDTIIVMHRRIPGHRAKGAGKPHPQMSYGVVLRSDNGGKSWSEPYDLRDCMKPEDRNRGGIVPLSHRAKFDKGNKSHLGYKVHLHAIGTARDGAVIAVNNHGVFRSDDAGRTWKHFSEALREDTFKHPIINIGPRILDDPKHGLLVFGNWFGEVDQYHKYSEKLVVLRSADGGATWRAEEHPAGFKQYEPAAIFHDGKYHIVTRDQNEVRSHRQMTWLPNQTPTITKTNLQDPRLVDTVDLSLNPVTKRLEIVRSERHRMELWLWSIAPDDWPEGEWRRECSLFQRQGRFYADADGFHPAGAVIDEERGVQHIFIYTGHPNGPAGVFRLTRTLDTPKLVKFLGRRIRKNLGADNTKQPNSSESGYTNVPAKRDEPPRNKTLFLDDDLVAEMTGLKRVMHRPVKKGAVFLPRGETDGIRVQTTSAPVWDPEENVFKLFYMGFPYRNHGWIAGEIGSALAVSKDGLDWKRPVLKQVEIGGSSVNNRFFVVDRDLRWGANKFMEVIHDPHDSDPQRRYKGLLGAIGRKPVVSPDGIHWKTISAKTIPSSDTSTLIYDELGKRYVAVLKNGTKFGRSAAVAFSTDFKTWTSPRTTFHTDEQDQRIALDRIQKRLADPNMQNPVFNDPHPETGWTPPGFDPGIGKSRIPTWRAETYKLAVFPYEGLYMGMPQIYYPTGPALPQRNNTVGFHEIQLAFNRDPQLSREGWKRLGDRRPFIETSGLDKGLAGNFDRQQLGVLNRPVVIKDELWFYYTGAKGRSLPYKLWPDGTVRNEAKLTPEEKADFDDGWIAICLATLRLDGFVSLTAGDKAGQVVTKPFVATGDRLLLNVDVSDVGEATVEVLNEDMQTIDGFELSSSVPLSGRSIEQTVRWATKANWSELEGEKVRLRIRLRNADLYAFWTAKEQRR